MTNLKNIDKIIIWSKKSVDCCLILKKSREGCETPEINTSCPLNAVEVPLMVAVAFADTIEVVLAVPVMVAIVCQFEVVVVVVDYGELVNVVLLVATSGG